MANVEKMIAETFLEMAQGLESGSYGKRPKIALTGMGSEHGEENAMEAALMAAKDGVDVYYIGSLEAEGNSCPTPAMCRWWWSFDNEIVRRTGTPCGLPALIFSTGGELPR